MKKLIAPLALAVTVTGAVVAASGGAALAAAPTTITLHPSDLAYKADISGWGETDGHGNMVFTDHGLQLGVFEKSDKVMHVWAQTGPLSDLVDNEPSQDWTQAVGTVTPGMQIVVDLNHDGATDGILAAADGQARQWYASPYLVKHLPVTTDGNAPATALPPGQTVVGSSYAGTLAQWVSSWNDAQILAVGFTLGKTGGDEVVSGTLHSMTFGEKKYVFANEAPPVVPPAPVVKPTVVNVTAKSTVTKAGRAVRVAMTSTKLAAGTVQGKKVHWTISVDGKVAARYTQGAGERDAFVARFAKKSGKHVVTVSRDGKVVRTVKTRA